MHTNPTYRVVQWSTGTIGVRALRAIVEHPDLALAGVYVHGDDKVGRDAGELCGLPPVGMAATADVEDVMASGADCVLYMPNAPDVDTLVRMLSAGINVVTTCGLFHHPDSMNPVVRQRIQDACLTGGASIHSTGSSPGFITEAMPLVLASIQRRLNGLAIDEYADLSRRPSPELLFDLMGFGKPMGPFEDFRADYLEASFGPSLRLVADALGLPLDSIESSGELAAATRNVTIAAGPLSAGTVAAQRITIAGIRNGSTLIRFRATWYCATELSPAWDLLDTGWHISVDGDAPLEVDLRMPIPLEKMAEISPAYTANRAINAVPYVCSAPPRIRSTVELPSFVPALGHR
ncbi:NAD(P)H-dependent amine dehydrogenase family protein [Mycolicibacterium hodleri]|uniref:Dihydrodipicolinate reductase n=1 Tax=Mycolicibacterium hodleri TaxID=49897 RepID=A0A502E832_9MYCO|nr:dihydrodipicolinate reductase [Mycolicibacterium hodleri]TPG33139.1 dihydrodipicolinate reductase [Mycolicibacterium hodleri]